MKHPGCDSPAVTSRNNHYQKHHETVAIESSESLVELMHERGVENARQADMFALRETFDHDRFQSALAFGTQLGLAGSMDGLRRFLCDLAVGSSGARSSEARPR